MSVTQLQPDDAAARQRIREALHESLIVEASAGTGKTSELVRRIVNVLGAGHKVDAIVAVTFTNKAAGELKLRLRQELDRARNQATESQRRDHLEDALARLEEASIGTIHSFCGEILRERPVEARVDPAFNEVSQSESDRLFKQAFHSWVQTRLDQDSPGLRRALSRIAARDNFDGASPIEQLEFAARKLVEWRDYPAPWQALPFARHEAIDALVDHLLITAPQVNPAFRAIADLATRITRGEEIEDRDHDELEGLFLKLLTDLRRLNRKGEENFVLALEQFKRVADADLAWHLREELIEVQRRYEELKARTGQLDFLDLLLYARDLVVNNSEVRAYLQKSISHIFVDEFQDTDPLQAELFLLLAADDPDETDWLKARPVDGKLFLVGDPKQSVYKFRRADVEMYERLKRSLVDQGVGVVRLTKSFRSVRPIQEFVNAAFAPEMTGNDATAQAQYSPLGEHAPAPDGRPSVIALPVPRPYGMRNVSRKEIDRSLPDAICAHLEWLIHESGWQVRDPEHPELLVPIKERHICLLFRRFLNFGEDLTREYVRSLEARGLAHLLVGSKSFHSREEVETVRAALNAIEWPDDELSVFATLHGSLFALNDETLFNFRQAYGRWFPFVKKPDVMPEEFAPVFQALDELARLHRGRNKRAVADTVNQLLESTRAHAGFALRPAGDQVLANVYRIADLARSYEVEGGISFRGFVDLLDAQSRKAESAEAPVLEEGAEGVRIMTVHAAKGLEFPVVYLADITANLTAREPDRYVDSVKRLCAQRLMGCTPFELLQHHENEVGKERAEGVRVAYVAATRAKDLLIVPAVGTDELKDCWVSPLHKALYPSGRDGRRSELAPGCPAFGESSVMNLPSEYHEDFSVKPGLHHIQGAHDVVWWDPYKLRLGVESSVGLRQEEILAGGSPDSTRRYKAWQEQRQEILAQGRQPQFEITSPTELREPPDGFWIEVPVVEVPRLEGRPKGPRFGTLVHSILHDIDFADADVTGLAALHGRIQGAEPLEVEAAATAVTNALGHSLLREAAVAPRLHREYPIALKLRHGFVEGKADLAYQNAAGWTLIDFKTDAELDSSLSSYQTQLLWYAFALHTLTSKPVRAFLLSL